MLIDTDHTVAQSLTLIYKEVGDLLVAVRLMVEVYNQQFEKLFDGSQNVLQEITNLKAATDAAFTKIGSALQNIAADEKNLLDQIAALKGSTTLSAEDKAALDGIATQANSIATQTQTIADSVAEVTPPPAPAP